MGLHNVGLKESFCFFPFYWDLVSLCLINSNSWDHCWIDPDLLCFQALPECRPISRSLVSFDLFFSEFLIDTNQQSVSLPV